MTRQELQEIAKKTGQTEFDIVYDACVDRTEETGTLHRIKDVMSDIKHSGYIPKFVAIAARTALAFKKK
jgi:hypothetical protein